MKRSSDFECEVTNKRGCEIELDEKIVYPVINSYGEALPRDETLQPFIIVLSSFTLSISISSFFYFSSKYRISSDF